MDSHEIFKHRTRKYYVFHGNFSRKQVDGISKHIRKEVVGAEMRQRLRMRQTEVDE